MRTLLAILTSMIVLSTTATAQNHLPVPISPYMSSQPLWVSSYSPTFVSFDYSNRHLQLKPFLSVSAGFMVWNGGGASYLSAPAGLMLIRPLNNNLAAFSSLSFAPSIFSPMYHDPAMGSGT